MMLPLLQYQSALEQASVAAGTATSSALSVDVLAAECLHLVRPLTQRKLNRCVLASLLQSLMGPLS